MNTKEEDLNASNLSLDEQLNSKKAVIKSVLDQNKSSQANELRGLELDEVLINEILKNKEERDYYDKRPQQILDLQFKDTVGLDYSVDFQKAMERAAHWGIRLDESVDKAALIMLANTESGAINDELLERLYKSEIRENQLTNPVAKKIYHYYIDNVEKEKKIEEHEKTIGEKNGEIESLRVVSGEKPIIKAAIPSFISKYTSQSK